MTNNILNVSLSEESQPLDFSVDINSTDLNIDMIIGAGSNITNPSGTGLPTIDANSFSYFDSISNLNIGVYEIIGNKPGLYISNFDYPYYQQMIIWDNDIYIRRINVSELPVIYPAFASYGSTLFQTKITSEVSIQYWQSDSPASASTNSYWFNPVNNILQKLLLFGSTSIWIPQEISNGTIYKFDNNSYIWTGEFMILLASGNLQSSGLQYDSDDIVIYSDSTGNKIKSSGVKISELATKIDLESIDIPSVNLDTYMQIADYVGSTATGIVKESENSTTVGGKSPDEFAKLDILGQVDNNISVSKLVGQIDSSNLPAGFVDEIVNVKFWQQDYPTTQVENDYFYTTLDNVLSQYINSGWIEIIPAQNVIYNNFSIPNEAHPHRWSGNIMISTENPLSFATTQEAQIGENTSKVMSALRVVESFIYQISNKQFSGLDTTSKTIQGAINELNSKAAPNATQIPYSNTTYPTVAAALNKLLYVSPTLTSFTNNINNVEKGVVVSSITFNWLAGGTITTQSINNGVGIIPTGTFNKTISGVNLTSNTTWTITVSDGTTNLTRATSIAFMNKMYWGASTQSSLTDLEIRSLSGQVLASGRQTSKIFDATGGKYIYFIVPTSFSCDVSKFKVYGLPNSDWQVTTRSFINASGYSESYSIFRLTNIQTGSAIPVEII